MSSDNPWAELESPNSAQFNAKRVDPDLPRAFFWMVDGFGRPALGLRHRTEESPSSALPELKGMTVDLVPEGDGAAVLALTLTDTNQKDVFHQLCLDIVHVAGSCESERSALQLVLNRTWRWHYLLAGGSDGRLSEERQKGLFGELLILTNLVIPAIGPESGVKSWLGPTQAPRDFEIGHVGIEVKARREGATPYVRISSEHQLDSSSLSHLFLAVVNLARPGVDDNSRTLDDLVAETRRVIAVAGGDVVGHLEKLLAAAGFRDEDGYEDSPWAEGDLRVYEVAGSFPRIAGSDLIEGVSRVTYRISLNSCAEAEVEISTITAEIGGNHE